MTETTTSKLSEGRMGSFSIFQFLVGATLALAGVAAILRLSNVWTVTDVRYAEYSIVLLWGGLLMVGALRHRHD